VDARGNWKKTDLGGGNFTGIFGQVLGRSDTWLTGWCFGLGCWVFLMVGLRDFGSAGSDGCCEGRLLGIGEGDLDGSIRLVVLMEF
jgi:hypothetical protein